MGAWLDTNYSNLHLIFKSSFVDVTLLLRPIIVYISKSEGTRQLNDKTSNLCN